MGQDMSSNKQETLDRALDCFLRMTLGIIDIETLNNANIQAATLRPRRTSKSCSCPSMLTAKRT